MALYGGIDLHSNNNVTLLLDEQDRVTYQKRLPNACATILEQLAPYQEEIRGVVVESTYNWYWLVDGLMDAGYRVHLANPAAIQQYSGLKYTDDHSDARWLAHLGDWAYDFAIWANTWFNVIRRKLGLPYWSLSAYLKHKVKNAVQFIDNYEHAVASEARRRGVDGVVCGHIHHAEIRTIDGVLYCNDGDWVESCTALVEDFEGRLRIVRWAEEAARRRSVLPGLSPARLAAE